MSDEVEAYAVALTRATRERPELQLGASPRATVALYRAAQAWAAPRGPRLRPARRRQGRRARRPGHRLMVDLDQGLRGATAAGAVSAILDEVPVPPVVGG